MYHVGDCPQMNDCYLSYMSAPPSGVTTVYFAGIDYQRTTVEFRYFIDGYPPIAVSNSVSIVGKSHVSFVYLFI